MCSVVEHEVEEWKLNLFCDGVLRLVALMIVKSVVLDRALREQVETMHRRVRKVFEPCPRRGPGANAEFKNPKHIIPAVSNVRLQAIKVPVLGRVVRAVPDANFVQGFTHRTTS